MTLTPLIGNTSLNISFVLYLVLYIPQVLHNRQSTNIAHLSFFMHFLLLACYFFDLMYGIASDFQWQYKTVSVVGLSLILVQHLQLTHYFITKKNFLLMTTNIIILTTIGLGLYYFFILSKGNIDAQTILIIGSLSRICSFCYSLPQLIKNKKLKSTQAISIRFIYLNLTLATLDTISAWCLNWGWPNKLASPVTMLLMVIMLTQVKQYAAYRAAKKISYPLETQSI